MDEPEHALPAIDKRALRRILRQKRASLDCTSRESAERHVFTRLETIRREHNPKTVGVYAALGSELSVSGWAAHLSSLGLALAWPRVEGDRMRFYRCDLHDLVAGYRGILEPPQGNEEVSTATLDLLIVPGVGFGANGARLGQGGGFYDRYLAELRPSIVIGVCFDLQVVIDLPKDDHDAMMDIVLTETRVMHR